MAGNENQSCNTSSSSSSHDPVLGWKTPTLEKVNQRTQAFCDWYQSSDIIHSTPSTKSTKFKKVIDMSRDQVLEKIEKYRKEIKDEGPDKLLDQSASNTRLVGTKAKRRLLEDSGKSFKPRNDTRIIFRRVLDLVHGYCKEMVFRTLRSLFYMDVDLFGNQSKSNKAVNQVCGEIGCTRSSLNVFATDRGTVIGHLSFKLEKREINCNLEADDDIKCKLGQIIPPFMNLVSDMKIGDDVHFILFVESYSIFLELTQENFHNNYHCIIITGTGQADVASRQFTSTLMQRFKLPAFSLSDCDPWGIEISAIVKHGSVNMAYDSKNLACPWMYWLGIWPTDLKWFDMPLSKLEESDKKKIEKLLKKDFVIDDVVLTYQLRHIHRIKQKASLEALSGLGTYCLSRKYLPYKLYKVMGRIMEGRFESTSDFSDSGPDNGRMDE